MRILGLPQVMKKNSRCFIFLEHLYINQCPPFHLHAYRGRILNWPAMPVIAIRSRVCVSLYSYPATFMQVQRPVLFVRLFSTHIRILTLY